MLSQRAVLAALFLMLCMVLGCGTGPAGPAGAAGATGAVGAVGPAGPVGPAGLSYRSSYVAATPYSANDAVTYGGSTYIALLPNTGVLPVGATTSAQFWALLASAGMNGANGVAGAVGPAGPQGAMGVQGVPGVSGMIGAQGPVGPQGPAGPAGSANTSADIGSTATIVATNDVIFGANNAIPTGDNDTIYGVNAGTALTTGREMTIIGAQACPAFNGDPNAKGSPENGLTTCIGSQAGLAMVSNGPFASIDNVFIGQKAAVGMVSANEETIVGVHAGTELLTGRADVIMGSHTMDGPTTVNTVGNVVLGQYAYNGQGNKNFTVAVGFGIAPVLQTAASSIFIGPTSGNSLLTAQNAILIGDSAGNSGTTMTSSLIVGSSAGSFTPSNATIVGPFAGQNATAASTFLGYQAGNSVSSGSNNTCLGQSSCGHLSTGSQNVAVGLNAGSGLAGSESNTVAIGAAATTAAGVSNAAQIGQGSNLVAGSLQFNATEIVDGNGDLHAGTVAPASNSACTPGAVRVVMPYVYACVIENQWMRSLLSAY